MPRELIRDPNHDRARSLGWLALAWMEYFTVHGPGDIEGRPLNPELDGAVPLDDELAAHIVDCYGLAPRSGRRLYDSAFFSRAKGRDKSGQAGRIVLFEALGPCRFAGWAEGGEVYEDPYGLGFVYVYAPGEPMGRHVTSPFIRVLATEERQTGNTYATVYLNLTEGPLAQVPGMDAGKTRIMLPAPYRGEVRPSTSADASKDGGLETFAVFDETHLYVLPALRSMYDTVRRNLEKRLVAQPWYIETSTMYQKGEESVAEATHTFARQILRGETRGGRLLFDHREASLGLDLTDEAQILQGLREAYGPFAEAMDLERMVNSAYDTRTKPGKFRRYFFNQTTEAADAWLSEEEWKPRADVTAVVADGEMITLGFDGSQKRARGTADATALVGCRVEDGHLFVLRVWEQPEGPDGQDWRVPVGEVEAAVAQAFERYTVVGFYADPAKWESSVSAWEAAYGRQLHVAASRSNPIEWWMTGGRSIQIVRATDRLYNAIVDGEMTHDGDHVLTRHALNARRRSSHSGVQIMKEHPESAKKIDAIVAGILAFQARADAIAHGVLQRQTRKRRLRRY
ncbi:terminase large subunit [Streptomonospora litoralis]|uniref:Phage Terminase n=1 Tax=Streptomonospora litoralis TaxID=2498135 RepID=A0A4P6Q3P1_9ACTN|nr:terminase large subunit [Streptomonospora litoralis]QBI53434.1 Phage Terminase [Streptomonospora litoralis]